ncbi:MAG: serine/threonine-protein phosphatase [Bdellovibrionales bacterium CG10_big_fil_rev_8_21_14_0_10_45_34]|nr:MAG: serine/threonine-protein phosphatase [Bdellovibrionales bacterium CG10_big_fil_rev_8_21_14_0_10_45_34]
MKYSVWAQTDRGLKRQTNQDTFLIDRELALFAVADGMGGHKGGEVASALAVQTIREVVSESFEKDAGKRPLDLISDAFLEASDRIYQVAQMKPSLTGMGTTMVAILLRDNIVYVGNVGDSRAYLFSEGRLWQVSEDHSLMCEQLRSGILKESDVADFASKNIITRSVGFEPKVQADLLFRPAKPGEIYLLCSDGVSGMLEDTDIERILTQANADRMVPDLIEQAKDAGGDDNITALLLSIESLS